MSGNASYNSRYCFVAKLLFQAIVASAFFATIASADERPASASLKNPVAERSAADSAKPNQQHIEKLIRDLGNSRFAARRAAANELRQIGPEAFDLLYAATDDEDPEVAASANYLLRQIPVRWVQADDPSAVQPLLRLFSKQSEATRKTTVGELDKLPVNVNTAALCRIARYDRSPLVSRTAAIAVIRHDDKSASESRPDPDVVERELGTSTRASAKWLRQYLVQLRDPASSVSGWKQLIEQESSKLEKNVGDTSNDIVLGLSWNLADVYRQIGDSQGLRGVLDRMIVLATDASDQMLVQVLNWLTEHKSWEVLDGYLAKHQSRFEQNKRSLYTAAIARSKQGKKDVAEELAARAAALPPQKQLECVYAAKELEQEGQFDWAVREYKRTIEKQPPETLDHFIARIWLPSLLHDYERDQEAAEAIEPLLKAVRGEGRLGQLYMQLRQYGNREYGTMRDSESERSVLPSPKEIAARYHSYRAGQYQQAKDWAKARTELEQAISSDPTDADVLISMYRLPDTDEKFKAGVRERINKMVQKFQREIDDDPTDPSPYNQWAWIVSNTEGDFQKAIRYSKKSLDLNTGGDTGEASFLDTLGRCYYAAGDYKNAVKSERQALEKMKYMQVMQRQLVMFEKALAEQESGSKKSSAGKSG